MCGRLETGRTSAEDTLICAGCRRLTRRTGKMAAIPASTNSLAQRLREHARKNWPQPAQIHVRYCGQFAHIDGELADGERLPLMRLRYGGSAHRWGTAVYVAGKDKYEDQIWFSGKHRRGVFDLVCNLHIGAVDS
jgi:hypothetical protein